MPLSFPLLHTPRVRTRRDRLPEYLLHEGRRSPETVVKPKCSRSAAESRPHMPPSQKQSVTLHSCIVYTS